MSKGLRWGRWAGVVGLVLLGSCGGGGGSDEGGGVPGGSGLVPTAAAPGATLLADATPWRLLRPGAEWVYAGRESGGSGPARSYTARTLHGGSTGAVTETVDDGTGDPTVQTVSAEAGQVRVSEPGFEGLLPPGERFVWTELASPVRAGEQRTLLDRGQVDLGSDLDSDGRNDRIDIAAWTTVVGFEDLIVPALATPLRTLRVDIVAVSRLRLTRLGLQPVERLEISTWYAEGLGVVRQRERDLDSGLVRDHALQAWDGVTAALGAFGPDTVAAGDPAGPLRGRLPQVRDALPVDGGEAALVLTDSLDPAQPRRLNLARLDARGRLQASASVVVEGLFLPGDFRRPRLLADGRGAVLVDRAVLSPPDTLIGSSWARVFRVDGRGQPVGPAAGVLWQFAGVPGGIDTEASDGERLWFVFRRENGVDQPTDVVVHVRAPDGRELAPPMVVLRASGLQQLSAAASPGQGLVLTSYERTAAGHQQRVLRVPTPGAMPLQQLLVQESFGSGLIASGNPRVWPVVSGGAVGLLWRGPILARDFFVPRDVRGVLLGDGLVPLRSTAGSLDTEALPVETAFPFDRPVVALDGERWLVAGHRPALDVPPFSDEENWLSVLTPARSPLAPQFAALRPLRLPDGRTAASIRPLGEPTHLVPLSNRRLLVIGRHIGDATVVTVALP